jgi:ribose-phosphate pyrophosphokinase
MYGPLKILSGTAAPHFAETMASHLGVAVGRMTVRSFKDGERFVEIHENVRGRDLFVVQPTCSPVNDRVMELLLIIDAAKRSSAGRITAVMPYYGYARQDRKTAPRTPISSKLVADLLTAAGASRVLTMDLHAGQIQGFFDRPVDHIFALPALMPALEPYTRDRDTVIVSPDAGGVERARAYARRLGIDIAVIDKRRDKPNEVAEMRIVGDVEGRFCILLDDLIDTAGTLTQAAKALREQGATGVIASCTHPVLSDPAIERIQDSVLERVIVTDTIPLEGPARDCEKIDVVTVAPLLAEAVRRIHEDDSVSDLFE